MPLVFSREQIRKHLADLGFKNVPEEKLNSFIHDLKKLIKHDEVIRHQRRLRGDGTVYTDSSNTSSSVPPTAHPTPGDLGTSNASSAFYSPPITPTPVAATAPTQPLKEKDVLDAQQTKPKPTASKPIPKSIVIVQEPHKPSSSNIEVQKQPARLPQQELKRPKSAFAATKPESKPAIGTEDLQKRRPLTSKQSSKAVIVKDTKSKRAEAAKQRGPSPPSSSDDDEFERLYNQLMAAKESSENSDEEQEQRKPKVPLPPLSIRRDPVALYHFYKKHWDKFKIPGEEAHMQLRWNVRAGTLGRIPCDPDGAPTKYLKDGMMKTVKRDPSCKPCQLRDEYLR